MQTDHLSDIEFQSLRKLVYRLTGISLSDQKRQLLKTRLQRRMRELNVGSFMEYHDLIDALDQSSDEVKLFINAVTTNKTDFFRENHHFEFLREVLAKRNGEFPGNSVRIWSAACSTGEEPYTIAITLDQIRTDRPELRGRILATDIDTDTLAHAQQGVYGADRVEDMNPSVLQTYFQKGKGGSASKVRVRTDLQEDITFRRINLLQPWPFKATTEFDFIICRNVMIYFDRETQNKLIERFWDRLAPGGYLFLGHSESMHGSQDRYKSLGKTIYQKKSLTHHQKVAA